MSENITREQVIDFLSNLSVMAMADLVKELEDKWGVEAAAGGAVGPCGAVGAGRHRRLPDQHVQHREVLSGKRGMQNPR